MHNLFSFENEIPDYSICKQNIPSIEYVRFKAGVKKPEEGLRSEENVRLEAGIGLDVSG